MVDEQSGNKPVPMYRVSKKFRFEASHVLPHHAGKCARLHGHSWTVEVVCEGGVVQDGGSEAGMLIDYGRIMAAVMPLLDLFLDHYHLNDSLGMENPTSESVAAWVFGKMQEVALPDLAAVIVEETCTSRCEYRLGWA